MHQANMNQTAELCGARSFGLVPWEKLIGPAGANPTSTVRQPLSQEAQRRIFAQFQKGESIEALAARYRRPRASIARLVKTMRAERIAQLPLDFIPNRQFPRIMRTAAEQKRFRDLRRPARRRRWSTRPRACRRTWPPSTRSRF